MPRPIQGLLLMAPLATLLRAVDATPLLLRPGQELLLIVPVADVFSKSQILFLMRHLPTLIRQDQVAPVAAGATFVHSAQSEPNIASDAAFLNSPRQSQECLLMLHLCALYGQNQQLQMQVEAMQMHPMPCPSLQASKQWSAPQIFCHPSA